MKQFVWWSDKASRKAGTPSVLACIETIACILVYFLLALKFGVTWHHWIVLIATPLVLLRSSSSIEFGRSLFDIYLKGSNDLRVLSIESLVQTALAFFGAYFFAKYLTSSWLTDYVGWSSFWRGAVVGWLALNVGLGLASGVSQTLLLAVAGAMAGAMAGAVFGAWHSQGWYGINGSIVGISLFWISASIVVPFGMFLRAAITRAISMMRNPVQGLKALPHNWRVTILSEDFLTPLELVPGHDGTTFDLKKERFLFDTAGNRYRLDEILSEAIFAFLLFGPILIWRWAVKSTAWFYFPYLVLGWGWSNAHGSELLVWGRAYGRALWNWVAMLLSVVLLFVALAPLIGWNQLAALANEIKENGGPVSPIVGLLVLDWRSLGQQPWYWFYLPSWCLTIWLFFAINRISAELAVGGDEHSRISTLSRFLWVSNLRFVLTNVGLATALFYFLRAIDAWGRLLEFIQEHV